MVVKRHKIYKGKVWLISMRFGKVVKKYKKMFKQGQIPETNALSVIKTNDGLVLAANELGVVVDLEGRLGAEVLSVSGKEGNSFRYTTPYFEAVEKGTRICWNSPDLDYIPSTKVEDVEFFSNDSFNNPEVRVYACMDGNRETTYVTDGLNRLFLFDEELCFPTLSRDTVLMQLGERYSPLMFKEKNRIFKKGPGEQYKQELDCRQILDDTLDSKSKTIVKTHSWRGREGFYALERAFRRWSDEGKVPVENYFCAENSSTSSSGKVRGLGAQKYTKNKKSLQTSKYGALFATCFCGSAGIYNLLQGNNDLAIYSFFGFGVFANFGLGLKFAEEFFDKSE